MKVLVDGWEDGERRQQELEEPDRWGVQAADALIVESCGHCVRLKQDPSALKTLGVGALLWEGALVLAQYMSVIPSKRWEGARVVELGAGLGLAGILAGKLGARVTLTDVEGVLPVLQQNADLNSDDAQLDVIALEWGSAKAPEVIESLTSEPIDWVIASDFMYPETPGLHGSIDLEGGHPTATAFFDVAAALCKPKRTRCLLAFEVRGDWMIERFQVEAKKRFKKIRAIPRSSLAENYRREHIEMFELMIR